MATAATVTVAYVAAAEIGFRVAFVAEQVTTVWAPTGIALATLLLGGIRYWPAIWIGAFLVNAGTAAPPWTAAVIASGNTLEAVVAASALQRLPSFDLRFRRIADVLAFVGVGVVPCTVISATVGVVTLCAAGVQPWPRFAALWFDWWLGDALGALVVGPAILTTSQCATWRRRDTAIVVAFAAGAMAVTHLAFGQLVGPTAHPLEYVVFPVAIAAAVIQGPPATTLAVLSASAIAIWNTVRAHGPFASGSVHESLILLQTFMGVLSGTALLLAAAIAERETSERREKEAARVLRDRDELLQLAQRAGGVATFAWDFQNQIAQCSAEFFRIFGLPEQDGQMAVSEWAEFVHPADRERMAAHLARALERREPAIADYRIVRRDGSVRWLSYAGRLEKTTSGDRMLGTVLDVTARKQTEIVLEAAKNSAESANQLKDQFLATLSHELRTPLNAILGYARMLRTNTIAAEKREHALEVIERNALAQHQLVEDLLDMSRITTGRVRLDPEPMPVAPVLREAIEGIRPAADAKRIALDLDLDPFAGTVTADRTRLQQVFWNVLTNAVKFTGQEGRIAAVLRRENAHVAIAIRDTGAGISAEFLPFVFDPFRQADARLGRGHGGLGLGLAISRQLVELHGGTIEASSAGEGQGATFVIRHPRRDDEHGDP